MNIIGISGLEGAMAFKRAQWPGLEEREYRISQGHDAAAALVVNGVPVAAAAEERFNREKHSPRFPVESIHFCLKQAGIAIDDIDLIAHSFHYAPHRHVYMIDAVTAELYRNVLSHESLVSLVERSLPGFPPERIRHVDHHLAHAASAYYTSGWDDCLVAVIDGMGEVDGASVYRGQGGKLKRIARISALHSIGILYSLVTLHLGFEFNSDEYKIMGLAPYGDASRFRSAFERIVELCPNGTIRVPILGGNRIRQERETYALTRRYLTDYLVPPRAPIDEITDVHRDVAAALQKCLDRVVLHICGHFGEITGMRRLALAGGVALNCTANGRLARSGLFEDLYIQPAAGDDGAALGAALHWAAHMGKVHNVRFPVPYLGPAYTTEEIDQAITEFQNDIEVYRADTLAETCEMAAGLIAAGHVIAWYRGRMEFGPRALGHRSILADPSHPEMRDRINAMVKKREAFRPFAPAVSREQVHLWFEVPPRTELPYMITTADVRSEYRAELPAITHVNGSARIQTVSEADDADFYALLRAVGRATGREIVLNTSFNVKGQPIVNTPHQALETFLSAGIEFLFLDNRMISNRRQRERSKKQSELVGSA